MRALSFDTEQASKRVKTTSVEVRGFEPSPPPAPAPQRNPLTSPAILTGRKEHQMRELSFETEQGSKRVKTTSVEVRGFEPLTPTLRT